MHIGGLVPCSLVDFPSKVSAVIFTVGCNFRCSYCHNPHLVEPKPDSPPKIKMSEIFDFLVKRKDVLDGIVVSGGEPTLQRGLLPFFKKVKSLGYLVKLDTNGSNPKILKKLIKKKLIDYIAMDIKVPIESYGVLSNGINHDNIRKSIQVIIKSEVQHEFRTTAVKPLHDLNTLVALGKLAKAKNSNFVIQKFVNENELLDPEFAAIASSFSEDEMQAVQSELQALGINCSIR